jgi:putative aldouronate transport system substrate-binding protein
LNQLPAFVPSGDRNAVNPPVEQSELLLAQADAYARNRELAVFNPASTYLINSPEYSMNGGTLDTMVSDARIQYICGQIDLAALQAVWAEWSARGGQKIIDEVNAQYAANN